MSAKTARDVMETGDAVVRVAPSMSVRDLARVLVAYRADGAIVVDADDKLIGIVTEMDLVFQEKNVHLPTMLVFMDAVLNLDLAGRSRKEIDKITGTAVADIMTPDVVTAAPDTPARDVATWMVERHLSVVPVVDEGVVIGAVTRPGMLEKLVL